jgi:hypothetical protein
LIEAEGEVKWQDISAIWLQNMEKKQLLHIKIVDECLVVDIGEFDPLLWDDIISYVDLSALDRGITESKGAQKRTGDTLRSTVHELTEPVAVWQREAIAGWIFLATFSSGSVVSLLQQQKESAGFLAVVSLAILMWAMRYGRLTINKDGVGIRSVIGSFWIGWDEIDSVRIMNESGKEKMLLYTPDKWLLISNTIDPNRSEKVQKFINLLYAHLNYYKIPVREVTNPLPDLYPFKNCRVW